MSKAADAGKSFLAGVFAKLTPEQRTQAETIFGSPDATAALEVIGTGALAQPEINRQLDDLRSKAQALDTLREQNETWYADNKAAVEHYLQIKPEYERLKTSGGRKDDDPPLATGATKEEIQAELERRDRSFAGAMALGVDLAAKHLHMFNEPLNMTELFQDPRLGSVDKATGQFYGLQDAYNAKHGDRVKTKAEEAHKAAIEKEVQTRLDEERRRAPQHHPFPIRDSTPSPLDALDNKERKTTDYSVDSAVAEYERLAQQRSGAPS